MTREGLYNLLCDVVDAEEDRQTVLGCFDEQEERARNLEQVASMNPRRHELLMAKFEGRPYDEKELEMLQEQVGRAFYHGVPLEKHLALEQEKESWKQIAEMPCPACAAYAALSQDLGVQDPDPEGGG